MENLDENINNKNVSLSLIAEYGASDSDSDDSGGHTNENGGNDDSESGSGLSEMVLKNNIINACAHGPMSRSNLLDDADTTRHMIIDSSESGVVEYVVAEYRDMDSDSDSSPSSESSESVDSVLDLEALSDVDEIEGNKAEKPQQPKVQGELGLEDLPPIEDLAISLPAQETTKIGTIASIVDRLVVVRAFPDTPAVDLDSVLFLENGSKALGKVFDVFGPVTEPHYCVRFNSIEHVKERGVQPGMDVYFAPRTQHTNYVFLSELMKLKGSDASWLNDVEPPPHQVDYSDDEEERKANRARKEQRQNRQEEASGESSKNPQGRKVEPKRTQRPSESSSRFGSGPSRGRNPFSASKRNNPPGQRFARPWSMEARTPPPHPEGFGCRGRPPFFPPPYNPGTPPPFMNSFQFGGGPRMPGPMPMMPPFRQNVPVFGSNYQSQWANGPPPPPGT